MLNSKIIFLIFIRCISILAPRLLFVCRVLCSFQCKYTVQIELWTIANILNRGSQRLHEDPLLLQRAHERLNAAPRVMIKYFNQKVNGLFACRSHRDTVHTLMDVLLG